MAIVELPAAPGTVAPPPFADHEHPMRRVTRQVAFEGAWDRVRAEKVAALFDSMAAGWTDDHDSPERLAPLEDALARGRLPGGLTLELGSGSGLGTRVLRRQRGGPIVAVDLAFEMLRAAPAEYGWRVHADAADLPVATGAATVVVLVNALLFPAEVDRVLAPAGRVVWVNTMGERTPIHLPAAEVAAALPGTWDGVASRAGSGTWAVLGRGNQEVHRVV